MSLVLQIDTDELYEFYVLFDSLSETQKIIWKKLLSLGRAWDQNIASQTKIGEWCSCSRSAVSEAFRKFKSYGWMHLESRGWKRSKRIIIAHSKLQMNLEDKNYFKQVTATYKATHTISTRKPIASREEAGDLAIKQNLQNLKIPLEVKLKLSLVSDATYQEALYQCKKKAKKGLKFKDEISYLVGTAIKIAEKRGEKLDWRSYYKTLRNLKKEKLAA